ncbi:Orn Lys Arg decarboxylase class-II [Stylosanthes scabra]|uniref:Arginine decarboxylase n=1 Tax=Stylosanthes scabra TaxID=79078 RepID=A0ABU6W2R5_9FABA|nr:Orn Lys Arg decarboxylase class-II [Stylosanthes scabra]
MPALACCVDAPPLSCPAFALTGGLSFPPPLTFPAPAPPLPTHEANSHWSPSMSALLYNINGWGAPYFTVNSSGNVAVCPHGSATLGHQEIDLLKIVKKATDPTSCGGLGLQLPLMVRFPDVLKNRLESLQGAFDNAIQCRGYGSHYQGVYPVKCNQDRFIVEDIVEFGSSFRFGLEAGSKPELLLAMSCLCKGSAEGLVVCNGFKDAEYISLALVARKLALNTIIVLEQEEELDMIIHLSNKLCIRPAIGFRAKLRTKHSGHFGSTSGEKGKFGLSTAQIVRVVKKLQVLGMLDCLELLHFHIGSMIPSTSLLADGVTEAAQIYCELVRMGANNMRVIDIGGGLGIDYSGSKSSDSEVSVGYGLEDYAAAVVESVQRVCDERSVKHPVICSESGRAIVSHQSVLVFEAFSGTTTNNNEALSTLLGLQYLSDSEDSNLCAAAIRGEYEACLLYIEEMKRRCLDEFKEGSLGMEELAGIDGLCDMVRKAASASESESESVTRYHVNMSVFTSIPDLWGIQQVFPILPIHRLDEKPAVKGMLSDLTCDSDGKVDRFINGESSLALHEMVEGEKYYLGMFLGGAYQEALGGLHNLFGGPSVVRVSQSDVHPHGFAVTAAIPGPSCGDVLRAMQHHPQLMLDTLRHRAFEHLREDTFLTAEAVIGGLAHSFNNTPYLVVASSPPSSVMVENL